MPRIPLLTPEDQFPRETLKGTVQDFPRENESPGNMVFTWNIASAADQVQPWGKNVLKRDQQLRDFFPTEPYLAGAITNVGFRHAALQWEVKGPNEKINQVVTDMLLSALGRDSFGWANFMLLFSQDLCAQDNGAFVELVRDPGVDANSKYKGPLAPVLGIAHLDSNRCVRTGNPEYPIKYTSREGATHKLRWYEVIPFADQPSAIETMNGVGYCAVSRVLRMAQIARSLALYKDEKVSGRMYKQIHFVSGVSRQDIKDEMKRGQEEANNAGMIRFIMPAILASLDPEKPVSTATIDLASLPDGFNFDEDMKWYISCLALGFGVDYQEFAPLPGGNIGSSQQSMVLHRKGSGKGPAVLMRMLSEAFRNYGVLPMGTDLRFNDKDEQEELERQTVRTKAVEEMAIAVNTHMLTPQAAAKSMVARGIWGDKDIREIDPKFWEQFETAPEDKKQPVGDRGGNTVVEDAGRQEKGKQNLNLTVGDRLRKGLDEIKEHFTNIQKAGRPNIAFNIPESPAPLVNVLTAKLVDSRQNIKRDKYANIETTSTEMKYDGYVISSSPPLDVPAMPASMQQGQDGTIIINAPTPKRQTINIKMPKVTREETTVVRDKGGNIAHVDKKVVYEE